MSTVQQLRIVTCPPGSPLFLSAKREDPCILKILLTESLEPLEGTLQHKELKNFFSYPKAPADQLEKKLSFSSGLYTIAFGYENIPSWTMKGKLEKEYLEKISISVFAEGRDLTLEEQDIIKCHSFEFSDPKRGISPSCLVKPSVDKSASKEGMRVTFICITRPDGRSSVYPVRGRASMNDPLSENITTISLSSPPELTNLSKERRNKWLSAADVYLECLAHVKKLRNES